MNKKVLFIGGCGHGKATVNGVSAKNYFLLAQLRKTFDVVKFVDTDGWKRNPLILLKLVFFLTLYRRHKIVISLNTPSAYRFLKVASSLFASRHICYFVIGGVLADNLKEGKMQAAPLRCVNWFLVESFKMRDGMRQLGFPNVMRVPNFKLIPPLPAKPKKTDDTTRFLFLSRIIADKGCDYIFDALDIVQREMAGKNVTVDFYGPIDDSYRERFEKRLTETEGASYKGFIDLRDTANYAQLATYDAMLFPTYWHGEGFPGIIIDAFIAGLPVIASDWGHNKELIDDGQTGIIIPVHDVEALAKKMEYVVSEPDKLSSMSATCQAKAHLYDVGHVLSEEFFRQIID